MRLLNSSRIASCPDVTVEFIAGCAVTMIACERAIPGASGMVAAGSTNKAAKTVAVRRDRVAA